MPNEIRDIYIAMITTDLPGKIFTEDGRIVLNNKDGIMIIPTLDICIDVGNDLSYTLAQLFNEDSAYEKIN